MGRNEGRSTEKKTNSNIAAVAAVLLAVVMAVPLIATAAGIGPKQPACGNGYGYSGYGSGGYGSGGYSGYGGYGGGCGYGYSGYEPVYQIKTVCRIKQIYQFVDTFRLMMKGSTTYIALVGSDKEKRALAITVPDGTKDTNPIIKSGGLASSDTIRSGKVVVVNKSGQPLLKEINLDDLEAMIKAGKVVKADGSDGKLGQALIDKFYHPVLYQKVCKQVKVKSVHKVVHYRHITKHKKQMKRPVQTGGNGAGTVVPKAAPQSKPVVSGPVPKAKKTTKAKDASARKAKVKQCLRKYRKKHHGASKRKAQKECQS